MAHYARVNGLTKIVEQVIVADEDFINDLPDKDFWIQTSYNIKGGVYYDLESGEPVEDQETAINEEAGRQRKNFAGLGYTYDSEKNAFIPPKDNAFFSWKLNEETCLWEAPVKKPDDGKIYEWDESNTKWVETDK